MDNPSPDFFGFKLGVHYILFCFTDPSSSEQVAPFTVVVGTGDWYREWFLPCFCAKELILGIMKNAFVSHKMDSKIFGSCSACQFSSAIGGAMDNLWF